MTRRVIVAKDAAPATVASVASKLRAGRFGLVLWIGDGVAAQALTPLVRAMPATKFVYVDASLERLSLQGVNASATRRTARRASGSRTRTSTEACSPWRAGAGRAPWPWRARAASVQLAASSRWPTAALSDLLTRPYKEYDWGISHAVERFLQGTLPSGEDLVLGLADDYAVGLLDTKLRTSHCSRLQDGDAVLEDPPAHAARRLG